MLKSLDLKFVNTQSGVPGLNRNDAYKLMIPLPPLDVQAEIVAEIEGYQKIIDGARQVVENYRPRIEVDPAWPVVRLGDVTRFIDYRGKTPQKTTFGIPLITAKNVKFGYINREPREYIAESDFDEWMTRGIPTKGDVLFTTEAPLGNVARIDTDDKIALAQRLITLVPDRTILSDTFLMYLLLTDEIQQSIRMRQTGSTVYGIKASTLKEVEIPLPDIGVQCSIADQIEYERVLVAANSELIALFEQKIKDRIAKVWGG
jgi:restriction endonuclease S subunit